MSTVGYGDIYPKSVGGRIIGMILCVWGVFLTSLIVITMTNFLEFNQVQKKSFMLLERLFYKKKLTKCAA
jgi:succinate-acetate transporter protein